MPIINYIGKNMKTFHVSQHQHDYWEIIYCTNGDGTITFFDGSDAIEYSRNQVVIIPPHTLHTNDSKMGFKNIYLTVANWTPSFKKAILLSDNPQKDIFNVLTLCYRYFNSEVPNQANIILSFTELILNIISGFAGSDNCSQHVEMIANSIVENFSDPNFSLDDVYATFPLSKDYIRRQFIKEKGISPLQFLNVTRIGFAQKLLLSKNVNNYKIYEIAEMCGFSDQLYFSRVFKKITGVSPKEYTSIPKSEKYNSD